MCFDISIENCDALVLSKLCVTIINGSYIFRVCVSILAVLLLGKNFFGIDGPCRFCHLRTKIWCTCTVEIKPTCIRKIVFNDWIAYITLSMTSVTFLITVFTGSQYGKNFGFRRFRLPKQKDTPLTKTRLKMTWFKKNKLTEQLFSLLMSITFLISAFFTVNRR